MNLEDSGEYLFNYTTLYFKTFILFVNTILNTNISDHR